MVTTAGYAVSAVGNVVTVVGPQEVKGENMVENEVGEKSIE